MAEEKTLFNIAFDEAHLSDFYESRNLDKWFSKDQVGGSIEFKKICVPSDIVKETFENWWNEERKAKDKNIYSFNSQSPFTLIMYDSRDDDSVLCKDIILKQYSTAYNRDVTDWTKHGVVVYDSSTKKTDYPTYNGHNIFYPSLLSKTTTDEVFVCGYSAVDKDLLKQFSQYNEKIYVFESNQHNINKIKNIIGNVSNGKLCMSKFKTKSYQAFALFRDPIDNLRPEDNDALKVLKDYSDLCCLNFDSIEQWEEIEKIKTQFEKRVVDTNFRENLVNKLFGETVEMNVDELYKNVSKNKTFENLLNNNALKFSGNSIAINTTEQPSLSQIKQYVSTDKTYSMIITFNKSNDEFWIVKAYRTPRELSTITLDEAKENTIYYLANNGASVKKIVTYDEENNVIDSQWFYCSSNKLKNAKLFNEVENGEYALDNNGNYVKFVANNSENYVKNTDGVVKHFKITDTSFLTLCEDNKTISFNKVSLSDYAKSKYVGIGNRYCLEAYMDDKTFYKMLNSTSLV